MKKPHRNVNLALVLIGVWIGGCRAGDPTQRPSAQPSATAPAATEPAAPQVTETATEAPTSPITVTDEPTSEPTPPRQPDVNWDDRTTFRAGLVGSAQEALDGLPGASVYHIDLQIASDLMSLQGHQQVRYTNQEGEPLDEVYFQLFPNTAGGAVTVSAVQVDGQAVESAYEYQNSALRVPLPTALQPGEQTVIQMDFEVQVAQEMAGNFGLFGYFEGVLVLDGFYPVIPVHDDEGWNVQDPPSQGDVTYFDTSFYQVQMTAPADLTVVASGIQVSHEETAGEQVLVFVAGPARDFYLAASDDFTVVSQTVGETTINSYTFPERTQGAELALRFAADAISSFSERLGPYPYTEFDVISAPMLALGIEYPGMTSIALTLYDPEAEVIGLPSQVVLESTVAHEVGHQWFYNVVGNDQVDEPWMDEAIVQYVTGLYFLDVYGEQAEQGYRASWYARWDRVERADIPIGLPAEAYADNAYGAIVYGRGPLFVAALAEEMGQETFDAFLRDYYQSHRWGIGTGESFRRLAEQHCACDLSALFEEWVYEKQSGASPGGSLSAEPAQGDEVTGTALLIFGDRFIHHIYAIVRPELEEAGYNVVIASRTLDPVRAKSVDIEIEPDILLEDVQVEAYDAIIFSCDNDIAFGGGRPETDRIAQEAVERGKVLAAICAAPMVLGYAGVVEGKEVTGEPSNTCRQLEANYGATCTNLRVQQDGLLITAKDRYASGAFVRAILETLREQ